MILIAGYGFVGKAHEEVLKRWTEIKIIDPKINQDRVYDFPDAKGLVICVATPQGADGSCNMTHVIEVLNDTNTNIPVLIKSTISIEGWQEIKERFPEHKITFSPEFLKAKSYLNDIYNMSYMIISNDEGYDFWIDVFNNIYKDLAIYTCNVKEAIATKNFANSYLATKVSFFNQIYDFCQTTSLDFEVVRRNLSLDYRIGDSHTYVVPEEGIRGFGGHCFPKDTSALLKTAEKNNVSLSILNEAVEYNKRIRK